MSKIGFPNLIRRAHPDWDANILAKLGWDTGDELKFMRKILNDSYQVDLVVLIYCMNDVSDLMPEVRTMLEQINGKPAHESWLCRKSYLFDLMYYRFKASHNSFTTNVDRFLKAEISRADECPHMP
jgi:hypothetical protein